MFNLSKLDLLEMLFMIEEIEKEFEDMERRLALQEAHIVALEKGMELYEKEIENLKRRAKKHGKSEIFTDSDIQTINELYHFWGYTQEEIAQRFGTSQQRISEVINRQVTKGK